MLSSSILIFPPSPAIFCTIDEQTTDEPNYFYVLQMSPLLKKIYWEANSALKILSKSTRDSILSRQANYVEKEKKLDHMWSAVIQGARKKHRE